jgi:aminoglycoside phosphotransferase (APT) family kinase protein
MPVWDPEIVVDEPLARRLIADQFPQLAPRDLRLLGEGWDSTVWRSGEWTWRFPRRQVVVPMLEREVRQLPRLQPLLPLQIPVPVHAGTPSAAFPWPFAGARYISGQEMCDAQLSQPERDALAPTLAAFLRVLHSEDVLELLARDERLPLDPFGRGDAAQRVPRTREALADVEARGLWSVPQHVEELLSEAQDLPAASRTSAVHGDLHLRHLLVHHGGASAVIDWIDLMEAAPAVDLILYWSAFSPAGRAAFLEVYGDLSEAELLRARVLAFNLCAILASYASAGGFARLEREAVAGLSRAAAD